MDEDDVDFLHPSYFDNDGLIPEICDEVQQRVQREKPTMAKLTSNEEVHKVLLEPTEKALLQFMKEQEMDGYDIRRFIVGNKQDREVGASRVCSLLACLGNCRLRELRPRQVRAGRSQNALGQGGFGRKSSKAKGKRWAPEAQVG